MRDPIRDALRKVFAHAEYLRDKASLPILTSLIERYAREQPFRGQRVLFGHLLVMNSLPLLEGLWRGGAEVTICDAHPVPQAASIVPLLTDLEVPILPVQQAVKTADLFLDVGAVLGRLRTPTAAAEVTRTGVQHYRTIPCPVISADDCRSKLIEGYFGTGDGFVRAWRQLRPEDPLKGKQLLQFGYGKIGHGVARVCRDQGMQVTVVDPDPGARKRAAGAGLAVLKYKFDPILRQALAEADIVLAVTGIPSILSHELPPEWLRANRPVLVNLGAEDEFGPNFEESEILGGRAIPLNFHLRQPTLNRYVDPPLAAHLLALEAWVLHPERYPIGIHPLPQEMDDWVVQSWHELWPEEDLSEIGNDLGL